MSADFPAHIDRLTENYTAAWNSGDPDQVAAFFAEDGAIVINRGDPHQGRAAISAMAAGFHTAVPDLKLTRDRVRAAGDHVAYFWTFTGHDAETGKPLSVSGWEEWDLDEDGKVRASRGWFDADDYARQIAGG